MAAEDKYPAQGRYVVGVFEDVPEFKRVLGDLLAQGFDRSTVSVLAEHEAVSDHFGGPIPEAAELADRPDAPREDLDAEAGLAAAIRFLAESVSIIGAIGVAGAAFAVGGPVGVASVTGAATEATLEGALARYVDAAYTQRYQQSVRDGGMVCWVHVYDADRAAIARGILDSHGGQHVHEIDTP